MISHMSSANGSITTAIPRSTGLSALVTALLSLSLSACVTPFSELQSARLAGVGRTEITPAYTSTSISDEGESERVQSHYGLHFATGLSSKVDLRARFERIVLDDDGEEGSDGVNVFAVGPKIGVLQDRLALFLPVGFAFGSGIEVGNTFEFHPAVVWTIPVSEQFEVNTSAKAIVPLSEGDLLLAANLGLGLSSDLSKWAIRPEFGLLKNPKGGGTATQFSLGFTFFPGGR